jgi:hypothetical protein
MGMKNGKVFLRLSVIALLLACTSGTIVQAEDVSGKVNEVSESAEDTVYGGNAADGSSPSRKKHPSMDPHTAAIHQTEKLPEIL